MLRSQAGGRGGTLEAMPSDFQLVWRGWQQLHRPPRAAGMSLDVGCCLTAQTHRLLPGKPWLSPSLLMTDILADCCTLKSANPRRAIGFGLEDYRGESSYQMGVTVVYLLLLFSCLSKKHSELWPGLSLLIPKVLTILCSTVCNHLHFGVITF